MSMTTEDAIYRVEMCGCTGVACALWVLGRGER